MSPAIEVDHRNDLLQVRDQGRLPTCLSHATSTAHRAVKDIDSPLSAETLHYYATGADWTEGCRVTEIQEALIEDGQPRSEHCKPISESQPNNWSPPASTEVSYYRSDSVQESVSPESVKQSIRNSELPILGISFPSEFYTPSSPWVISPGEAVGLHAVVGVGLVQHNDETVVLIRNSWGEQWGNAGHAYLSDTFLHEHLKDVMVIRQEEP